MAKKQENDYVQATFKKLSMTIKRVCERSVIGKGTQTIRWVNVQYMCGKRICDWK
jgi:hypothetical protein